MRDALRQAVVEFLKREMSYWLCFLALHHSEPWWKLQKGPYRLEVSPFSAGWVEAWHGLLFATTLFMLKLILHTQFHHLSYHTRIDRWSFSKTRLEAISTAFFLVIWEELTNVFMLVTMRKLRLQQGLRNRNSRECCFNQWRVRNFVPQTLEIDTQLAENLQHSQITLQFSLIHDENINNGLTCGLGWNVTETPNCSAILCSR